MAKEQTRKGDSLQLFRILHGDCFLRLKDMDDESIDAVVSDPPYGLRFMGRDWDNPDTIVFSPEFWDEIFRVLKPGGVVKAMSGTRTFHRLVQAIKEAGFVDIELDSWSYGSGFPKSHNISKALDGYLTKGRSDSLAIKAVNQNRPGGGWTRKSSQNGHKGFVGAPLEGGSVKNDNPITDPAKIWEGYGSALKPAWEPVVCARKPL